MAHVFKDARSPYFFASWMTYDGRRIKRSTKSNSRTVAMNIAHRMELEEEDARMRFREESQRRYLVEDLKVRMLGKESSAPSCSKWFEQWLAGKERTLGATTYERYEFCLRNFKKLLGNIGSKTLDCITPQHIIEYRDKLLKQEKRSATINMDLKIIRSALEKARNVGYINRNPAYAVDLMPLGLDATNRVPFTPEQLAALLKTTEGTDWYGAILVGYYTALRLGDVADLVWGSINMEARTITTMPSKTKKLNRTVTIPISDQLYDWLKTLPMAIDGKMPVFPTLYGRSRHLSYRFAILMGRAGIKREMVKSSKGARATSPLSFHSLRHTATSAMANMGVPPEIRMKLTGHSTLKVHEGYTHLETETIRQAVIKMPKIG
jgi:integrase